MNKNSLQFAKHLNERGLDFEEYCAEFLRERGYTVRFEREHEIWDADLVVEPGIEIDVKGSHLRKLKDGKLGYGFLLHKVNRSRPIHEPVVALVCYDQAHHWGYYFFVPTAQLRGRHYIEFLNPDPRRAGNKTGTRTQTVLSIVCGARSAGRRAREKEREIDMHANTLRKTKYDDKGAHYFEGQNAREPELPWRKWIRENLPSGPEGFCFEDIDGIAVLFDPQRHINKKFMLVEFKWWNVQLDRSQMETLTNARRAAARGRSPRQFVCRECISSNGIVRMNLHASTIRNRSRMTGCAISFSFKSRSRRISAEAPTLRG
jgi:hypothetical protein